jgi:Zn-dependent protease with chaperone function
MVRALYFAEAGSSKAAIVEIAGAIRSGNESALASAIENEKKRGGFELLMTHPLTAKRLERLMMVKKEIGT